MTERTRGPSVQFWVNADRRLIRAAGRSRRFIRVELLAPVAQQGRRRLPVNLAFVLDRSGSMDDLGKMERARTAVIEGIRSLDSEDRFSVVAYDDIIAVAVSSTPATRNARREAENLVNGIHPGGATDLCGGWLKGCEQVGIHLADDAVGRCLLLTDGLVNHGITDHAEIVGHCSALRDRRIATTTFGVGADFDESLLRRMADAGGGNFHFIEGASQIPEFIAKEVGEALQVTARNVALVVEAGDGVAVDSLNDLPCRRQDDGTWRVEVGSLFSGQSIDPLLRLFLRPERKEPPGK